VTPKPEAATKINQQARSQSASSLAPATSVSPIRKIEKSSSAVAPKSVTSSTTGVSKPPEKDIETLLDFIEGNVSAANEKKKAKKERQKQQRLEEIRAKELEEKRRREAEEAERKRREAEERLREELERQMMKKQKKKAAQRAKKAAAKGMTIEEFENQAKPVEADPVVHLEDLRARQLREMRELQEKHQKQLEEQQRKLRETMEAAAKQDLSKKAKKKSKKKENSSKASTPTPTAASASTNSNNINSIMSSLSKAGPGTQIKITRTANGGVEFTTIPADDGVAKKQVPQAPPHHQPPAMPPPYMQNMMLSQPPPTMQPYFPPQQQQPQRPPSQERPSVPSKSTPSQPMVTIRRIESGGATEPTVTISMQNEKDNKLLYTLINGQIHRAKDAPIDLIPSNNYIFLIYLTRVRTNVLGWFCLISKVPLCRSQPCSSNLSRLFT